MNKRARERASQEKQEAKREKRAARSDDAEASEDVDETALMDEFTRLSERYAKEQISEKEYVEGRRLIFSELGIETED